MPVPAAQHHPPTHLLPPLAAAHCAAGLYPGLVFTIAAVLNTIAIAYGSLAAVPFGTIVVVLLLWAFLSFPLCILGEGPAGTGGGTGMGTA